MICFFLSFQVPNRSKSKKGLIVNTLSHIWKSNSQWAQVWPTCQQQARYQGFIKDHTTTSSAPWFLLQTAIRTAICTMIFCTRIVSSRSTVHSTGGILLIALRRRTHPYLASTTLPLHLNDKILAFIATCITTIVGAGTINIRRVEACYILDIFWWSDKPIIHFT